MAAIGQLWTMTLAVACLGSGLVCLAMAVARVGDRTSQLTHGLMGLAMAVMLSPWGDGVPAWAGAAAFAVSGAWFASVALGRGPARTEARHLAIASAAMAVMYLMSGQPVAPGAATGGHAGHGASGAGGGLTGVLLVALSLVLAGYFVWHAWSCTERSRAPGTRAAVAVHARTAVRAAPVAHAVMSAAMAAMFLGVT